MSSSLCINKIAVFNFRFNFVSFVTFLANVHCQLELMFDWLCEFYSLNFYLLWHIFGNFFYENEIPLLAFLFMHMFYQFLSPRELYFAYDKRKIEFGFNELSHSLKLFANIIDKVFRVSYIVDALNWAALDLIDFCTSIVVINSQIINVNVKQWILFKFANCEIFHEIYLLRVVIRDLIRVCWDSSLILYVIAAKPNFVQLRTLQNDDHHEKSSSRFKCPKSVFSYNYW